MVHFVRKTVGLLSVSIFIIILIGTTIRLTHSGLSCPDWPLCYNLWILLPSKICAMENEVSYTYLQIMFEWGHRFYAGTVVGPLFIIYYMGCLILWLQNRTQWYPFLRSNLAMILLCIQIVLGGITVFESNINWSVAVHLYFAILIYVGIIGDLTYFTRAESTDAHKSKNVRLLELITIILLFNACAGSLLSTSGSHDLSFSVPLSPYVSLLLGHVIMSTIVFITYSIILFSIYRNKSAGTSTLVCSTICMLIVVEVIVGTMHLFVTPLALSLGHQVIFLLILTLHSYYYWKMVFIERQ